MAIDVVKEMGVKNPEYRHEVHHDLESFYWVLVYLVLQHTSHTRGDQACSNLFDFSYKEGRKAAAAKQARLDDVSLEVPGNLPLTTLLRDFTLLVKKQVMDKSASSSLTHRAVLDIMEKALGSSGWPLKDPAVIPQAHSQPEGDGSTPLKKMSSMIDDGFMSLGRFHSSDIRFMVRG
jgi:hypothetical protein